MKRNLDLIVHRVGSYYEILLPGGLENPRLYVSGKPYAGEEEFLCNIVGNSLVVQDPTPGRRPYFTVKGDRLKEITAADRLVDLGVVENCRDMGGYRTEDGKTVKWGRFFRGGALYNMDEDTQRRCDVLGLRSIFDYRDIEEAGRAPDYLPDGVVYHPVPAFNSGLVDGEEGDNKTDVLSAMGRINDVRTKEEAEEYYRHFQKLYTILPFDNAAYRAMLEALDSEETSPLYQHCSAGKDRTGIGCLLLLTALGVGLETAIGDYLLSRPYREASNQAYLQQHGEQFPNEHAKALLMRMFSVEEGMIQSALDSITAKYRSMEEFLRAEYAVTPERAAHWRALHTA